MSAHAMAGRPAAGGRRSRPAAPVVPSYGTDLGVLAPTLHFEDFFRAHLPALLAYATALTGDPAQAADVMQDVMVRSHSHWSRIQHADHPLRYVKRMVTNEYLSWRRRWHVRSVVVVDDAVLDHRSPVTRDHAQGIVDRDHLLIRLAALPRRQRTVLVLRYYEGMDDAEIAGLLRVTASTVRSNAARALATLRLQPAGAEE